MYKYLSFNKKLTFINLEDPIQVEKSGSLKHIYFGVNKIDADVNITAVQANPFVAIAYSGLLFSLN
jgi:UDP-N-acetylmuramoyl-tripeptide--D-alanyl-D-alanine ligase